jgi:coenzyme F420 hydrogenase subunit beta
MNNVVKDIVQENLCSSCGVCAGFCPSDALSMKVDGNGDLVPRVDNERCIDKCHLCLDICPFSKGVHNPRDKNIELFSNDPKAKYDKNIGWYIKAVAGFRLDEKMREVSASGGLATWCLEKLLSRGIVTRAAVVRFAKNSERGFFEFYSASTINELRNSSGSIYHPVEISGIIKEISSDKQKCWAIIGVPCLCSAIRNVGHLQNRIPFVFGLACGMYQNTFYTEMLLSKSGVDRRNLVAIEYRRKSNSGPPSDYLFRGTDNLQNGKEIPYHKLPYYLGKNAYFRQNACNYCMDVFSETADACFMDAWLPDYFNEPQGTSLVIIRNSKIGELLKQGQSNGEISIKEIGSEQTTASQREQVKRKQELIHMRLGMNGTNNIKFNTADKVSWRLQQYSQKRSKKAWGKYGRKYGAFVFWLAMTDVLLMQSMLDNILKLISLPSRFRNKIQTLIQDT